MNPFALLDRLPRRSSAAFTSLTIDDWASLLTMGNFPGMLRQTIRSDREEIAGNFAGFVGAFQGNSVVFAVEMKRLQLFSEARFQFQRMRGGRPGDLFGTPALAPLERPEYGQTTQDLLLKMLLSADFGGDAFAVRRRTRESDRVIVLRPDWVTMLLGSPTGADLDPNSVDVELVAIAYQEGGWMAGREPRFFMRGEFAHWAPIPDPLARYRGMPWLTPIIREIQSDSAATLHKLKFFENGATPNMVVTLDPTIDIKKAREWIELFEQDHKGVLNAYRTIYMGGGASQQVVGANLRQLDFKATQGAGETRIAAAGGIHPTIVGLSEGLQGSSLNAGNFGAARRLVADATLRPLWANLAGSLEAIIDVPSDARLWYDDRHIPFLADDIKDRAAVQSQQASMINTLYQAGFEADAIIDAVTAEDFRVLRGKHTGLSSVQLTPPGTDAPAVPADDDDDDEEVDDARAAMRLRLIAETEERLIAAGVSPTNALIGEQLDVTERTVRRWRAAADVRQMSA